MTTQADPWADWRARQIHTSAKRATPPSKSPWQAEARRVVNRVMLMLPATATRAEAEKALRDAYPFGMREYWPYRVWLKEQAAALHGRFGP